MFMSYAVIHAYDGIRHIVSLYAPCLSPCCRLVKLPIDHRNTLLISNIHKTYSIYIYIFLFSSQNKHLTNPITPSNLTLPIGWPICNSLFSLITSVLHLAGPFRSVRMSPSFSSHHPELLGTRFATIGAPGIATGSKDATIGLLALLLGTRSY